MKYTDVNIGALIEQKMRESGLNKSELARKIGVQNQNINRVFERESIDTARLVRVSEALGFDFFSYYRPIGCELPNIYHAEASGDHSGASVVGNVTIGENESDARLRDRVEMLERLLEEKERTIQILMGGQKD